ncbi:MAG: BNR-4 repeat-containing protein [Chitinispirillaceae bacterium]|nr:BNR-4 repeat-containing protein [Chitinispirillaceae bacterium]
MFWKLHSCRSACLIFILVQFTTHSQTGKDWVDGQLVTFNTNGAWCWFQDERAVVDTAKKKLIVGSVKSGGAIEAVIYDLAKKKIESKSQIGKLSTDDHNAPAFLVRPDGKYLSMFADHYDKYNSHYNIHDGAKWTGEKKFNWQKTNGFDSEPIAYSNLFYLSAEERTYNFARANDQSPNFIFSDDYGDTWEFGGRLSTDPSSSYNKGYYKYWSNGVDRIDFCNTQQHPRDAWTSIYHGYIKDGKTHDSFGNVIDDKIFDIKNLPTKEDFTKVFADNTAVNGVKMRRCWEHDICSYEDGSVAILFKARANNSETDHRNFYSRFDGKEWKTTCIGKAGTKMYSAEQDYTGLGALCPNDPNTVYLSSPFNPGDDNSKAGKREIWKGVTADHGATWTWTPVTANSSKDNFRPIVPAWNRDNTALLWFRGTYTSAQIFSTQVVGVFYYHPVNVKQKRSGTISVSWPQMTIHRFGPRQRGVTVRYSLPENSRVNVCVYSMQGRKAATLASGTTAAGSHAVTWMACGIPAGTYLCRMNVRGYSKVKTLTLF